MNDRPLLGRRVWHGVSLGRSLRLEPKSSLLVVGPTQSGKTTSLVVPALLSWTGPVIVTSVKGDVVRTTSPWRERLGTVQVLEPGRDLGLTWNPLEGVVTLRHALRVARDLTSGASSRGDIEFWNTLATKLVGALMMLALERSSDIFGVALMIEGRSFDSWLEQSASSSASAVVRSFLDHDARTLDGVLTTAETMVLPWRFRQPLARVREVLSGSNTLYLCSPRGEQSHYDALFRGTIRMLLEEQQTLSDRGSQKPLLLVLDEAATVGSLDELDQMAATVSGLDVTLITVIQDFAQLSARWGSRAQTIVNNHSTRVVLAGLADPTIREFLPELLDSNDEKKPRPIRLEPSGTAKVVAGRSHVFSIRLRPWWRVRRLRYRGRHD